MHQPFSDVDLLVLGDRQRLHKIVSEATEILEESNFPYKVDIVFVDDLADSYKQGAQQQAIGF